MTAGEAKEAADAQGAKEAAEEAPSIEETAKSEKAKNTERAERTERVVRIPLGALGWGAVVLASVLLLAGLLYFWYRPDRQTNDAVEQTAKDAAKDGVVAVYTYSAETIDRDISSAESHLTGDFLAEYKQYVESPAPTEAKQNAVKTAATVAGSAIMDLQPGSAQVLLFINQTTTSSQSPATALASRSVIVNLLKVDGKWLISSMKPA